MIAGAKGWFDIREYMRGHHDWFKRNSLFLNIPADLLASSLPLSLNSFMSALLTGCRQYTLLPRGK